MLLLRGGVFYISMSLWGVKKVESLSLPFTAVLPAIHQVQCCPILAGLLPTVLAVVLPSSLPRHLGVAIR